MAIDIATNQKVGGSNPFRRTKNTRVVFTALVFYYIWVVGIRTREGFCV